MTKFSTAEINRNFKIKVSGLHNGVKVNTLVGVDGLIKYVGDRYAEKFVERAFNGLGDVCRCKMYGGLLVSFYVH